MFEKIQIIATSFTVVVGLGIATRPISSETQTIPANTSNGLTVTFLCQLIDKTPNTVARISSKSASSSEAKSTRNVSVLLWTRSYYSESNETPIERCTRVSKLLQYYSNKGLLNYISYGDMDGKKVVCATASEVSPCNVLLFTLEKDESPKQLVDDLRHIIKDPAILSPDNGKQTTEIIQRWSGGGCLNYYCPGSKPQRTQGGGSR